MDSLRGVRPAAATDTEQTLNRSVMLVAEGANSGAGVLLLDRFEVPLGALTEIPALARKFTASRDLSFLGNSVDPPELEDYSRDSSVRRLSTCMRIRFGRTFEKDPNASHW